MQTSINELMHLGIYFWEDFGGFREEWRHVGTNIASKLDFSENMKNVFGARSWEQKSTKNLSKNGIQDGTHLGIDFSMILMDFGRQVGLKNPPKTVWLAWRAVSAWHGRRERRERRGRRER